MQTANTMQGILILGLLGVALATSGCGVSRSLTAKRQFSKQAKVAIHRDRCSVAEELWQQNARSEAVRLLETGSLDPDAPSELHVRLARMRLEMGQVTLAKQSAECAIDLAPRSAAAWGMRGRVWRADAQPRRALADFHRALALAPDDRAVSWEIAETYRELGQPQRALAALSSLANTYPPGEVPQQVLYLKGLAYTTLERYDDAVQSFSKATVREQSTAEILYRLAESQMLTGNTQAAATTAQEALALDPRHGPSLDLLGRTGQTLPCSATISQATSHEIRH